MLISQFKKKIKITISILISNKLINIIISINFMNLNILILSKHCCK